MHDFEFLAGMYGILLGLTLAEIAVRTADAIDGQRKRPIGWLTPLLAAVIVCDIN